MMAKITGQQSRDNRCVANLPFGESSGNRLPRLSYRTLFQCRV